MSKKVETSIYCGVELPLEQVLELNKKEAENRRRVREKLKQDSKKANSIKVKELIKEEEHSEH